MYKVPARWYEQKDTGQSDTNKKISDIDSNPILSVQK